MSPRAEVIADGDRLSCWLVSQSQGLEDTRRWSRLRQRSGPRPSGSESDAAGPAMGGPRVAVTITEWALSHSALAREIHEALRLSDCWCFQQATFATVLGWPEAPEGRSASTRTEECQGLTQHDGQYPGSEPRSNASSDGERSGTADPSRYYGIEPNPGRIFRLPLPYRWRKG